jgi:hypothetical protein
VTKRHPFRGLIGGLIFGFGLALILVFLSIAVIGTWTVIASIVAFGLIGLVLALVWPPKQVSGPQ